ncbi:hypothetical protein QZH41_013699, partial [Actinostola sp. cb2023]
CQQELTLDSREGKDLINSINHVTWEAGEIDRSFNISKMFKVDNPVLEQEFQTKRTEMKDGGRSAKELAECLAFTAEYYSSKIVKGRVKPVTTRQTGEVPCMEPTPNYDCHVSKNIPNQSVTDVATLMSRTQYYLYEYNEEGLPVNRPRHCLPYAVMHIRKACPSVPDIKQLSLIDEETTIIEPSTDSAQVPQDAKKHYIDDGISTMAWRGLIATKTHSLGVVAILAGHKIGLKVWKSFLDVRSKVPLDNLFKLIPGDIRTAWIKPLLYRGYSFSLCTLKPCGPSDNNMYINFIKSLSLRDHSAAIVNVDSSTILFLVPSCKLAVELGFCEKEEPWRMFCIVRRRSTLFSSNPPVIPNPEATQPSLFAPETLNINVKLEVPNPAQDTNRPAHRPVTPYIRSKSMDYHASNTHSKLSRRISDVGIETNDKPCTKTTLSVPSTISAIQGILWKDKNHDQARITPDKSVSISSNVLQKSQPYDNPVSIEAGYTTSNSEDESGKETSSSSLTLSDLFQVMRSKSIPFLEETQAEPVISEHPQCNPCERSILADQSNPAVVPVSRAVGSHHLSTNDHVRDTPQSNDLSKPDESSGDHNTTQRKCETSSQDVRSWNAYQRHREKLVPCIKKTEFTKMKAITTNDVISNPTTKCTSFIETVESHRERSSSISNDESSEYTERISSTPRALSPLSFSRSTKHSMSLKRRPSLSERIMEIKKLCLKQEDQGSLESDLDGHNTGTTTDDSGTVIVNSYDSNDSTKKYERFSLIDKDQRSASIDDARDDQRFATEAKQDSSMSWANGLQVVEAMLIEVNFLQIEEEIETFVKENAIEHLEVDATTKIYELQENTVQCVDEQTTEQVSSSGHVHSSDFQVITTAASMDGLVLDDPSEDTSSLPAYRSANQRLDLNEPRKLEESSECNTEECDAERLNLIKQVVDSNDAAAHEGIEEDHLLGKLKEMPSQATVTIATHVNDKYADFTTKEVTTNRFTE